MSCKLEYKGIEYNSESELLRVLQSDPDMLKKYSPKHYYRGEAYTREDIDQFDAKARQLQKAMNVQIIFDENIDNAHVLGKNDPKTKKAGKPVIMINPNTLFRETAIHEFGHIFLDSVPNGIENTRVKKAYEQLKDTPLEAEVREMYPNLSEEMFIKELITTAIGREGADIWDNKDDVTRWDVFKDWFLGFLNRTFGIPRDEIRAMAQEMLSGKEVQSDLLAGLSPDIQELATPAAQQESTSSSSNTTQKITEIEQTYRGLLARIGNALTEYTPSDTKAWKNERVSQQLGPTMYSRVKDAKKELMELYNTDQKLGLYKYVEWVEKELTSLETTIDNSKQGNASIKNHQLVKIARWDYAFETVDDIQSLMVSMERDGEISEEDAKDISEKIKDVQGRRTRAKKEILSMQRKRYVSFIAINDNSVEQEYIDGYVKEYKALDIEESGKTLEEHIFQGLQRDKAEIRQETRSRVESRALELDYDLDLMAANFYSEKNADSKDIQVLSKVVDGVDTRIKAFAESEAGVFDKQHKAFLEAVSNKNNMEEKYKNMYTVSESGDHYFTSKYKPEFIEAHNELKRNIYKAQDGNIYQDIKLTVGKDGKLYYKLEGEKNNKTLYLGPKERVKVEHIEGSMHVTLTQGEETETITVAEAIASSELSKWEFKNTIKNEKGARVVSDQWLNDAYKNLSPAQMTHLQFLKDKTKQADNLTGNNSRLRKVEYGAEFVKLPTMTKTFTQRVTSGEISGGFKDMITDIGRVKADEAHEFETKENDLKKNRLQVVTDISNTIQQGVPVKFRGQLKDSKEQSIDLHTITLANLAAAKEHKEKKEMEKTFLIILDVMKNRKVKDVAGSERSSKVHRNVKITNANGDVIQPNVYKNRNDGEYNDVLKAMDILERRIYGIKSKYAGEIKGKDINKLTNSWLKYSGMTSLIGNFPNSFVNYTAGSIQIYIEALGGEHFGVKDYLSARKTYKRDLKNILNDMGKNVDTSRTNLFMNLLNVTGENKILQSEFENQNKVKASFNMSNLRPFAKAGEHMMHALTMYSVMKSIKVMGPGGKYIDKKGKVVNKKKDAASLDEMIEFKHNEATGEVDMKLSPFVQSTTFTRTGDHQDIILETRNLIKNKIIDLQGNYDSEIAAAAQKHFWGKMLFFLRKWMIPAYQRRWKGYSEANKEWGEANQFYSQDLKGHKEGYYVTAYRFFRNTLFPAIKKMEWQLVLKGKEEMSAMEIANVRKALAELGFIALTWLSYTILDMEADGDDDDDTVWARYVLRRQLSELSSIFNPIEGVKIASTPTASIGMLKRILQVLYQGMDPMEEYKQGPKKGRNKLYIKSLKAIPGSSQYQKDVEDSLNFLDKLSF